VPRKAERNLQLSLDEFLEKAVCSSSFIFLGVDPGSRGAIAAFCQTTPENTPVFIADMPVASVTKNRKTKSGKKAKGTVFCYKEIAELLRKFEDADLCSRIIAASETGQIQVKHGYTKYGLERGKAGSASPYNAMQVGLGAGIWPPLFYYMKVYYVTTVHPAVWKRFFGLSGKDKKASIETAKKLFPSAPLFLAKHDGRAEALLIAEYARRTFNTEKTHEYD